MFVDKQIEIDKKYLDSGLFKSFPETIKIAREKMLLEPDYISVLELVKYHLVDLMLHKSTLCYPKHSPAREPVIKYLKFHEFKVDGFEDRIEVYV